MAQTPEHDVFCQNRSDYMFSVLTLRKCPNRRKCVAGIAKMLHSHAPCHPVLNDMLESVKEGSDDPLKEKAIFLFALHTIDDFVAYVMEQPGVCRTSISLFKHGQLPLHSNLLLDGNCGVLDYVSNCTADYICT